MVGLDSIYGGVSRNRGAKKKRPRSGVMMFLEQIPEASNVPVRIGSAKTVETRKKG